VPSLEGPLCAGAAGVMPRGTDLRGLCGSVLGRHAPDSMSYPEHSHGFIGTWGIR